MLIHDKDYFVLVLIYCTKLFTSIFANLQQNYGPWYCQNFVSAQYLGNKLMEFIKFCICIDLNREVGWDCYTSIFENLQQLLPLILSEFVFAV